MKTLENRRMISQARSTKSVAMKGRNYLARKNEIHVGFYFQSESSFRSRGLLKVQDK